MKGKSINIAGRIDCLWWSHWEPYLWLVTYLVRQIQKSGWSTAVEQVNSLSITISNEKNRWITIGIFNLIRRQFSCVRSWAVLGRLSFSDVFSKNFNTRDFCRKVMAKSDEKYRLYIPLVCKVGLRSLLFLMRFIPYKLCDVILTRVSKPSYTKPSTRHITAWNTIYQLQVSGSKWTKNKVYGQKANGHNNR